IIGRSVRRNLGAFMSMLLGLLSVTEGRVALFGQPPSRSTRQKLGYVPQGLGLYSDLTVLENLQITAQAFASDDATPPEEVHDAEHRLAGDVGLDLQRQLAFSCALGHHPSLLVLDERSSGVDPLSRARLWDTIHDQPDAGVAALITTHFMQ